MTFEFKPSVSVGDILTIASIFISLVALTSSWSKDQALREKELADKVRHAAASTLAKLERWQTLSLSLFQEAQPLFVSTSEQLAANRDVNSARDHLWKELNKIRNGILARVLEEDIETAYVELYGYHPTIRNRFKTTLDKFKQAEYEMFAALLLGTQEAVLSQRSALIEGKQKKTYQSATLGNALRKVAADHNRLYRRRLTDLLGPLEKLLVALLAQSDADLVRRRTFLDGVPQG